VPSGIILTVFLKSEAMSGKAVIWDLDGVIVDTAPYHFEAWRELAQKMGRDFTTEDFRQTFGMRNDDIMRELFGTAIPHKKVETLVREKEEAFRLRIERNITPLPGVLPLLSSLREDGFKLALVSSTPLQNIQMIFSSLGIEGLFECLVSDSDVSKGKPDPEGFLLAARRLELEPRYCVVIEDAVAGVRAAKAAGMKCIAVTGTHPKESLAEADLVVDTLEAVNSRTIELLTQEG
jgi:beta-phosphoglucomutase family hydrolase